MTLLDPTPTEAEPAATPAMVSRFLSMDPGSKHVGIAHFDWTPTGWRCTWAKETQPAGLYAYLIETLDEGIYDELVIERFIISLRMLQEAGRSRRGGEAALSEDAVETIECIGAVRLLAAMRRVPLVKQVPSRQREAADKITRFGLSETGLTSRGYGPHAKSAELHGWYRIWRQGWRGEGRGWRGWAAGSGLTEGRTVW